MADNAVVGVHSLPAELLEMITGHGLALNDLLNLRAASRRLNGQLADKIVELRKPDLCEIRELRFSQLNNSLQVSATIDALATAQHFTPLVQHASRHWKRKQPAAGGGVGAVVWLRFPILEERSTFALFAEGATVAHLTIDRHMPLPFTPTNIDWMHALLAGASVERLTLVLDHLTRAQLCYVPPLVALVHARHLELVLQNALYINWSVILTEGDFIDRTAATGIESISIVGDLRAGPLFRTAESPPPSRSLNFALVERLLAAGIRRVSLDHETRCSAQGAVPDLLAFVKRIALAHDRFEVRLRGACFAPYSSPPSWLQPHPLRPAVRIEDRPMHPSRDHIREVIIKQIE